jgi:hypothetical protein
MSLDVTRRPFKHALKHVYDELDNKLTDENVGATGDVTYSNTLIVDKDNATGFRLRGAAHADDVTEVGAAKAQSYAGMFTNAAYNTIGVKNTRVTFGANYGMDFIVQSPHGVILFGCDDTKTDGTIIGVSKTDMKLHLRADSEVAAPVTVVFDRVDTGDTGASNTSDVVVKADGGDLHLSGDAAVSFDVPAGLKVYTVITLPAAGTAGLMAFCTDGDAGSPCVVVDDGTNWKVSALGATASAS